MPHCTRSSTMGLSDDDPSIVTTGSHPKHRAVIQARSPDTRRNLYVLGLPFDLSTCVAYFIIRATLQQHNRTELSSIFSQFGAVTHSVILATVDNASRRRGFVVMSTHTEAKAAMDNISQTNIRCVIMAPWPTHCTLLHYDLRRGSLVDVSWAVVQRSQGGSYQPGACPLTYRITTCRLSRWRG